MPDGISYEDKKEARERYLELLDRLDDGDDEAEEEARTIFRGIADNEPVETLIEALASFVDSIERELGYDVIGMN